LHTDTHTHTPTHTHTGLQLFLEKGQKFKKKKHNVFFLKKRNHSSSGRNTLLGIFHEVFNLKKQCRF
jgi:hypothetical protein